MLCLFIIESFRFGDENEYRNLSARFLKKRHPEKLTFLFFTKKVIPFFFFFILKEVTAVTTNTRFQRFFSSGSNLRFDGRQSTVTMVFHALAHSRFFPRFSSTRKNMPAFEPFLQYFATGSRHSCMSRLREVRIC